MLPRVRILFENGALGQLVASQDGVLGLVATGTAVVDTFALNTPYEISKFADLEDLGITEANNPGIYKVVKEFYDEVKLLKNIDASDENTKLWLMGVADTVTLTNMADITQTTLGKALIQGAKGVLRGIIFKRTPAQGYTPTVTDGLDADVFTAVDKAQALCEWATNTLKAPLFALIEGRSFSGDADDLLDLKTKLSNRVAILIGDTEIGANACVGILAGRIAHNKVCRNIGAVKDGKLSLTTGYVGALDASLADVADIHDKGYITLRTHIGRPGYFFTDDPLAAASTDDYHNLTHRRTIDKAYRIAYDTLLDELLGDVPVTDSGTVAPTYAKSVEMKVENAIISQMTNNDELGNDPANQDDRGVQCYISVTQNIVSTGILAVTLKIKPKGYAKYIDVQLGFQAVTV